MKILPFWRQLIVIGSCLLAALSAGGAIGYPMVLLRQLSREDSPIKLDLHSSSWIGSTHGMAGIGSIITPIFMQKAGRRAAFIIGCLCVFVGWVVVYNAASVSTILLSEIIHGFGTNSLYVTCMLSMSEMTAPRFRNTSVQSYGIVQYLGVAISGISASVLNLKYVCIIMTVPIIIALFMSTLWPESPSWLAYKGRFDESYEAFGKLRKIDASSKMELEEVIAAQKENLLRNDSKNKTSCKAFWLKISGRDFYLPAIHVYVLLNIIYWSGSGFILLNSYELIEKTTKSAEASFWGGIVMNAVCFTGVFLNSIISRRFNNKTLLLTGTVFASISLFGAFTVSLLQSTDVIAKESLLCMFFLIGYMVFDSLGMLPISFTIISEIIPVKHRGLGGAVYVILNCFLYGSAMKISPYLFTYIDYWGTFLLFAINAATCGLIVWRFVPETKNKTLQQIEDFYMYGGFIENRIQPLEFKSSA